MDDNNWAVLNKNKWPWYDQWKRTEFFTQIGVHLRKAEEQNCWRFVITTTKRRTIVHLQTMWIMITPQSQKFRQKQHFYCFNLTCSSFYCFLKVFLARILFPVPIYIYFNDKPHVFCWINIWRGWEWFHSLNVFWNLLLARWAVLHEYS